MAGVKFRTGVLYNLTRYISYDIVLYMSQIKPFLGKIIKLYAKKSKEIGKYLSFPHLCMHTVGAKFCTMVVRELSYEKVYDAKPNKS